MEKRSLFDKIFGVFRRPQKYKTFDLLSGHNVLFTAFGQDPYVSDVVRATVHTIASNAAKLKARHIRRLPGTVLPQNSQIERLLTVRPNPYMNAYDFFYKIVTQLFLYNNVFVLIQTDRYTGEVYGFYPIPKSSVQLYEVQGELMAEFDFINGKQVMLPYRDLIHLRRHYNKHDIFGETNNDPLMPTLELINTTNQGIINAVKSSARLRGLLKFTQTMMKPEDLEKQRQDFVASYMTVANEGGVAALDAKADYVELKNDPKLINGPQMQLIEEKVYKYFNVNRNIVASDYTEDQWNAFYEGVLEPLAIQMSLEFTSKLFTKREQGHGNEIIFEANRLQYASIGSKIRIVNTLMDRGLLSLNECREIFNLAPIENGEKRLVSLNFVDADKANEYQLGEKGEGGTDEREEGDQNSGLEGH